VTALYTGKRVYPFNDGDIRLHGDDVYAPGWGPIPEDEVTLAEMFAAHGFRTALISDLYHQFKPSKNFARGFHQWTFLRGQEIDRYRSGPVPHQAEIDFWLAPKIQGETEKGVEFVRRCLQNMAGRQHEEDYFNARVMREASQWLEQNQGAQKFFLVVECFDPHEPWFVPAHYRRLYDPSEGPEHVISTYQDTTSLPTDLLHRAQMNYSGLVTMCDRWFGHLYQTMKALGRLEDTLIVVATDHGHSLGDRGYMGKREYPSDPSVIEVALMIRHPSGSGAGQHSDLLLQHTDIAAQLLEFGNIQPSQPLHGRPFWQRDAAGKQKHRDHVTVGWGTAMTVINDHWWLNCIIDGSRPLLYDLAGDKPFDHNVAPDHPDVVSELFDLGFADAGGGFPDYLLKAARGERPLPRWNPLAGKGEHHLGYI